MIEWMNQMWLDLLLAIGLLQSLPQDAYQLTPMQKRMLLLVAVVQEVIDEDQVQSGYGVMTLQGWARDLDGAPLLHERSRFPSTQCILQARSVLTSHITDLQRWVLIAPPWQNQHVSEYIAEAEKLRECWNALERAGCGSCLNRRLALLELREMLGEENWMLGKMPPSFPMWQVESR